MPTIHLSASCRDYVRNAGLVAVAKWRDNRFGVTRDPSGAAEAWWLAPLAAGKVLRMIQDGGDPIAVGRALGIPIAEHAAVAARVRRMADRLDDTLEAARRDGSLYLFDKMFAQQRDRAAAEGRSFPSYGQCLGRLRAALARAIANGGRLDRSLVASVFNPPARQRRLVSRAESME